MSLPVIHAGFQKCASTYLQRRLFPHLKRHRYIAHAPWLKTLGRYYYGDLPDREFVATELRAGLFYSHEGLMPLEKPFFMQRYGAENRQTIFLGNLCRIFPDGGRIVLVVRRQDSLMRSWLKSKPDLFSGERSFFVDYPAKLTLDRWLRGPRREGCLMMSMDFGDIAERIATILGAENLCILAYEEIAADFGRFVGRLNAFLGEDLDPAGLTLERENVSPTERTNVGIPLPARLRSKIAGRLSPAAKDWLKQKWARKRTASFDDRFAAEVRRIFAPSNERLARFTEAPLHAYGYY